MISVDELRKFQIFDRLTNSELEEIRTLMKRENHETGELIIEENSKASTLYFILEGRVSIKKKGNFSRRELVIDDALPGEIFGWSSVAEPFTSTATVKTTERSVFLTIDSEDLRELFEQNIDIGYKVMTEIASVISSRFRKIIGQFVSYI